MKDQIYRNFANIIENILEGILREKRNNLLENKNTGILKTHLIKYCKLKAETAEKYITSLEKANYITLHEKEWGDRTITYIDITILGKKRYDWFVKINTELS